MCPEPAPAPATTSRRAPALYVPTFTTELHRDFGRDAPPDRARRICIDLPGLLRTHGLRMIGFVSGLGYAATPGAKEAARASLARSREGYDIAAACFEPGERRYLHRAVHALMVPLAARHREAVAAIPRFRDLVDALEAGMMAGRVGSAFDDLLSFTYSTFVPALDALEAAIRAAVDEQGTARLDAAQDARDRAHAAREQVERIAGTIRIIAFNARVEAAHAGKAGLAFGVIAQEIRALSEQTETASREMASSIDEILGNMNEGI